MLQTSYYEQNNGAGPKRYWMELFCEMRGRKKGNYGLKVTQKDRVIFDIEIVDRRAFCDLWNSLASGNSNGGVLMIA